MDPARGTGEVATRRDGVAHPAALAGPGRDLGAERLAVKRRIERTDLDPRTGLVTIVAVEPRRAVDGGDEEVEVAVAVVIEGQQAATHFDLRPSRRRGADRR